APARPLLKPRLVRFIARILGLPPIDCQTAPCFRAGLEVAVPRQIRLATSARAFYADRSEAVEIIARPRAGPGAVCRAGDLSLEPMASCTSPPGRPPFNR